MRVSSWASVENSASKVGEGGWKAMAEEEVVEVEVVVAEDNKTSSAAYNT